MQPETDAMLKPRFAKIIALRGLVTDLMVGRGRFILATGELLSSLHPNLGTAGSGWLSRSPEERTLGSLFRGTFTTQWILGLLTALLLFPTLAAAAPPPAGSRIANTAAMTYGGFSASVPSNTIEVVTQSAAIIDFLKYAPRPESGGTAVPVAITYYDNGGSFVAIPQPPPTLNPTVPLLGALGSQPLIYYLGETLYLRLTDLDQNLNSTVAETILLTVSCAETADTEILRLTETGPNTGIFTGYMPTVSAGTPSADGQLLVTDNCHLQASYTDPDDLVQTVTDAALVDPYGIVFDSRTGQPVDGATVTLINVTTGQPALVYGDDGVSVYQPDGSPTGTATVITGGIATDESGASYQMPSGGFRFPYVLPGTYRLAVTAPGGYTAPSAVPTSELLVVRPDAALVLGSRAENFVVNPGPALRIDFPADPLDSGLWLQKQVNHEQVSVGEFLLYRLTLQNNNTVATTRQTVISDHLPPGFRYQRDSTRVNGLRAGEPDISADGRSLTFRIGDLLPGTKAEVSYVVEVAVGAKTGDAINQAQAIDSSGGISNIARATVLVREEFFNNKTFLLGRVLNGSCSQTDTAKQGLAGIRIYLEDGSYVVTDKDGKYHFEGIVPGTHVVQVDLASLPEGYEMIPCEQSSQFAGRSFSQFVDLKGGTLWQVNFYAAPLPAPTGEVTLDLRATLDGTTASFTATATAHGITIENAQLTVMLPGGFTYLPATAQRDGISLDDPASTAGSLVFPAVVMPMNQTTVFTFKAMLQGAPESGELPTKAVLSFDSPSAKGQHTPTAETRFLLEAGEASRSEEIKLYPRFPSFVAELQETDRAMLEEVVNRLQGQKLVRLDIVGHTDNQEISPQSRHLFANNMELSVARAKNVAAFLKARLPLTDNIMTMRGMGESLPVASNTNEEGRARNRRVELYLVTESIGRDTSLQVTVPASPKQSVPVTGLFPAAAAISAEQATQAKAAAQLESQTGLLSPISGSGVSRIEEVRIRLDANLKPRLSLDQREIAEDRIGLRMTEPQTGTVLYSYISVDFGEPGVRKLLIEGMDPFGNARFKQEAELIRTGDIASIRLLETADNLADGRSPVRIRIELIDLFGQPVKLATSVVLDGGELYPLGEKPPGLEAAIETVKSEKRIPVDSQGWISFNPVDKSGRYPIRLAANQARLATDIFVKPAMRDWILVGFAEGTVGYNNLSGNQVNIKEAGIDEHFYQDDQVKFFAKGAIKGEWLLTMAYDSKKPNRDGDSLHQAIDPDSYYPLYGDGTQQGYEAASARKLYVKIERDQFYALFGDMQTGLTQTELSQYSRSMNGFKSELQTEKFSYTLFAADTRQAFAKDEIRGDGTSGRYYLTQKNLVTNSETVTIETRDRFHSEKILDVQTLGRHSDYDIDYDNGSLFFKRPVTSKDANFNPIFIVVRYETLDSSEENLNYGGRVAAKLLEQKVEIGASYVHEARGSGDGDLYGTDLTVKLTPQTTLHAEAATTTSRHFDSKARGDAYLAEVKHDSERVAGRVYYREQQAGFGLGQQNDSEGGTRKYGVETTYNMTPKLSASGLAYHEDQLGTGGKRDVAEVQGRYNAERYSLSSGLREARDQMANGDKQNSLQWLAGGSWSTENRRLTLRSTYEQSLAGSDENSDYPTLLTLGADYNLSEKVSVFAEQEFSWGAREDSMGTRAGFRSTPWQGGTLNSSVERQFNENGQRVFALFGLGQSWQISERWSIDGSLDRSHTLKQPGNDSLNSNVPPAHGTADDFTAVSLGATYKRDKWTWWNRLEVRQADSEDKLGVSTSIVGEPRDGVAVSAKAMAFITDASSGLRSTDGNLRLGLAYRPATSRWIFLNRLDFYFDQEKGGTERYDSWRIVNNFHANFRLSNRLQTSFYSGLKYVRDTFSGDRYDSVTSLLAFEARYNLNRRWDIGVHGGVLHSWNSDTFDYTAGASLGYSPLTNTWVSLGYNFVGFRDDDFATANYTAQGAYLRFRAKFDQQTVREAAEWINK